MVVGKGGVGIVVGKGRVGVVVGKERSKGCNRYGEEWGW